MIQARLKIVGGRLDGKLITLPKGKFLIGREEDCQLRPKSELVSRHHCVFTTDDFAVRLRDLGSTNGTIVDGKRIQGQVVLEHESQVKVGNLEFSVRLDEVTEEPTEPEATDLQDTSVAAGNETIVDMPVPPELREAFAEPAPAPAPAAQAPAAAYYPQQPGAPVPPEYYQQYPPQAYPGQPQYGTPYPGQQPYPPQGYPPPAGYPGYPQPQYPPQSAPPQPAPPQPAPQAQPDAQPSSLPQVRLPDPSTTGIKEAPAPEASQADPTPSSGTTPSNRAEDIIRQYMRRDAPQGEDG